MGKRKERRLAAKIGAGRRVKLDLFAEPSGDLGGSSAKDDDGKDVDAKPDRESSNSPSSSGKPLENPLSLLGQYSDDELDDGVNEVATSSDEKQAKKMVEPLEEGEIAGVKDDSSQKADSLDVERDSSTSPVSEANAGRNKMVSLSEKDHKVNVENQDHIPVASDTKATEGMSCTWKMVLHEESNRYYYWNTVTGVTSWDVPDSLAQRTALDCLGEEMKETAASDINAPPATGATLVDFSASQGVGYTSEISDAKALYEPGALVNQSLEQSQANGSQFHGGFSVVGTVPYEATSHGNYPLSMEIIAAGGTLVAGGYQGHDYSAFSGEQGAADLPSHLLKNGEALLERLKLLLGSGVDSAKHGWLSKYMLEIEIRLSDIRCLLPYGSSLVPFWVHSERQFSRLENAINTVIGEQHNNVLHVSIEEEKKTNLESGGDAMVDASTQKLISKNFVMAVHDMDTSAMVGKAVHDEASDGGILNVQHTSRQVHPVVQEISKAVAQEEASPNPEFQSSEDVDMDIEMEIEDQSSAMKSFVDIGGQLIATPLGQLVQPSAPASGIPPTPESEPFIPPPPPEEWIPPPPPDEGIPPPPPDEPPETLCPPLPPPEPEPMPSIYSEQQNSTCMYPNVNYNGNTITESLGTSFHEHADASQVAALAPPAYYAAISNAQPASVLNPLDSVAYCGVPNGALPVVPVPVTIGSSNFQAVSGHPNYDSSLEHVGTAGAVVRDSFLPKQLVDPLPLKTVIAQTQVASDSITSVPASISNGTPVTGASTSVASASVSKAPSKAPRMKKPKVAVASSLRSNKKVSSLVDKWKAAKEELQEEEKEERESPLEVLEKKRQREIEGWRAQQIASGEAKENANFQPLGGDWRERVKRRRAQKAAAVATTSDAADSETKQLDLSELSRDLPPGWQAYWDDTSRQVYYANATTSETTWTRPTR